jgi:hypothetical protein
MMECPLCGSDNDPAQKKCYICDSLLHADAVETSQDEDLLFVKEEGVVARGRSASMGVIVAFIFIFSCVSVGVFFSERDVFSEPSYVLNTREECSSVIASYYEQQEMWLQQKQQILSAMHRHRSTEDSSKEATSFDTIPLEVIVAYLDDDLDFGQFLNEGTSLFFLKNLSSPTVIMSKYEGVWPLRTLVSLEVVLSQKDGAFSAECTKLRRGFRDLDIDSAWEHFGDELYSLRDLNAIWGGVHDFRMYKNSPDQVFSASSHAGISLFMSWKYLQHSIKSFRA